MTIFNLRRGDKVEVLTYYRKKGCVGGWASEWMPATFIRRNRTTIAVSMRWGGRIVEGKYALERVRIVEAE